EELAERGALVIATTHLEPLKVFASTHPRARNASVEFDTTTLAPTFRLRYDQPGQSYALTIAARLGLAPELIARAQAHRSEHAARLSDLLTALDAHARTEAERAREIERAGTDAAVQRAKARETAKTAEGKAKTIVERAKAEAMALLTDVRRTVAAEWDRLKRSERTRRTLEEGRQRLHEAAARVEAVAAAPAQAPADGPVALEPGQTVAAEHLGIRGELLTIVGGTATVRSGSLTVRVPLQSLRPVGGDGESERGAGAPSVRASFRAKEPAPPPREIVPELFLLGRTTDEARDIVDVVNRFVNLKKAGQNWKGLCPFHTEKTPSFMVNEKKGIFHCFGCGVGGDAFGFLMRQDKLSFPEAVRALAKQAGVALPEE